jgi:hypothetical protein
VIDLDTHLKVTNEDDDDDMIIQYNPQPPYDLQLVSQKEVNEENIAEMETKYNMNHRIINPSSTSASSLLMQSQPQQQLSS